MARDDEKRFTPDEIVNRLGVGYYEMLIEEYETRISNIRMGYGDSDGEYTYREDSQFKDQAEKNRRIEQLRAQIKKYEDFFNDKSIKNQVTARYIYEHLFLAHISFDDNSKNFFLLNYQTLHLLLLMPFSFFYYLNQMV